nr:MAG TPA: hypothetical protein [Caudoviricetes sp.]
MILPSLRIIFAFNFLGPTSSRIPIKGNLPNSTQRCMFQFSSLATAVTEAHPPRLNDE